MSSVSVDGAMPDLWPAELEAIETAVDQRRYEFAFGRRCAREALARLGVAPCAIPVGSSRQPNWPEGYVGSISHTRSLVAAAVGPVDRYAGLGLDLEIDGSVVAEVRDRVLTARELHDCSVDADLDLATLFFSAKESVYKATFPVTGQWLDFNQVEVSIEADAGVFTARIERTADHALAGTVLRGRFAHVGGHVMSITTLVDP